MKIFININQKAFVDLSLSSGIDLDLVDATIFEYVVNFSSSNNSSKKLIGNKLFVWISYQKIIDDNPLIRIGSKRAILNRLNNLEKAGLLEKIVDKESGNKTFFNVTDLSYKSIINTQDISNKNSKAIEPKCERVSNQNSRALRKNGSTNSMLDNRELNIDNNNPIVPLSEKEEKQVNEFNYLLKEVINYLNLRAKTNYKHTTRINQQHIHARVQEGFTLSDFKAVIDSKVSQWISDTKMSKFLRPQTLFSPKMEAYLNEPKPKSRVDAAFDNLTENFDMENLLECM